MKNTDFQEFSYSIRLKGFLVLQMMSSQSLNLSFHPAKKSDAQKAIPLIYSSGPTTWEYVFGSKKEGSALNFLRFAFKKGSNQFGYKNHIIGTIDGNVVACATYFSKNVQFKYMIQNLICILQFYSFFEAFSVIFRGLKVESIIKHPIRNSHCIAHVGVAESFKGKGLGKQMMDYIIEIGIALNRNRAELDVSCNNVNAYRLYTRLGFREEKTNTSDLENEFGKVDDHIKMVLDL